jgi:hypothetical protein
LGEINHNRTEQRQGRQTPRAKVGQRYANRGRSKR